MSRLPLLGLCVGACLSGLSGGVRAEAYVAIGAGGGALWQTQTADVHAQASGSLHDGNFDVEAQGYADLATGSLGLQFAYTPYVPVLGGPGVGAESTLRERLQLTGPGNALVPLAFTVQVDALLGFPSLQAEQGGQLHFTVDAGFGGINQRSLEIDLQKAKDANGTLVNDVVMCWGECSSFNQPLTTGGVIDNTIQFTALLSQDVFHSFEARVTAWGSAAIGAVAVVDALNTVQLSVSLPPQYTLSSESGVFLGQPVPEPASWVLLMIGGAAVLRRRLIG